MHLQYFQLINRIANTLIAPNVELSQEVKAQCADLELSIQMTWIFNEVLMNKTKYITRKNTGKL